MATYQTNVAALQLPALGKDWKRAAGVKVTGDVGIAFATYTLLGTETAADFIEIVNLPDGTRVLPHLCKIVAEDPGTALSGTVGDAVDPDRYSTALALDAGGVFDFAGATDGALEPYLNLDNTSILFDITVATALTAGKKVTFYIAFVSES